MLRESQRPRLLLVGDAVATTGFATVTRNLCRFLQDRFEIHQLGLNYYGDPHEESWKIYPAYVGGDFYGVGRLRALVEELRPDLVLAVNDLGILGDYLEQLREVSPRPRIAMYCPIDSEPLEPAMVERLEGVDRLVAYTRFGKRALEEAAADVRRRRPDFRLPAIDILPHGVDCRTFRPLRAASRRDAFIVLNANRNQPRKRIDLTIAGFALFAGNKPASVKLYLHMGVEDCGWNVERLAERYGIRDRLLLSPGRGEMPAVSTAMLNAVYNASVVGVNTCYGEGWGLVSFEHAATGAAQVVPRHSACEELWEGSALLVEPVLSLTSPGSIAEEKIVSPEGVAEALESLYEDPVLLRDLSMAAWRNATRRKYRWSEIARRWSRLLLALLGEPVCEDVSRELDRAA